MIYAFGTCTLDTDRYELRRAGMPCALEPHAVDVLAYLLEHRERVVTKQELLEQLWPNRVVGEAILAQRLMLIRKAIGDSGRSQHSIKTVHGRGYRFTADVAVRAHASRASTLAAAASTPGPPGGADIPLADAGREISASATALAGSAHEVAPALFSPPPHFVGRDAELAQLTQLWISARSGIRQAAFVVGEAGIGKTALVDAFVARLSAAEDVSLARGQCMDHYGTGEPYLPVLEALGRMCRGADGERLVSCLRHYAPSWLAHFPVLPPPEREALARSAHVVTPAQMLRELTDALEVLTAIRPLVLVLEDLHWSDRATLAWLAYLTRRRDSARVLILGTYRTGEVFRHQHPLGLLLAALRPHAQCVELALDPLPEPAVAAYLSERCAAAQLPASLPELVFQRTGGHPLFVVAMVDEMLRAKLRQTADESLELLALSSEYVPANLREYIDQNFERLSGWDQLLLEAASAAGSAFSIAAVAAALAQPAAALETRCAAFARRGQFIRVGGTETWPDGTTTTCYRFKHALYHEVVYARLAAERRIHLHRRIGARKEAGHGTQVRQIAAELAMHFVLGGDTPRAIRYLHLAGQNALRRSAYQEGIVHVTQGLEALGALPDSAERAPHELSFLTTLGLALVATKGQAHVEVGRTYSRARALCQGQRAPAQLFQVLLGLFSFHVVRAEIPAAWDVGQQLLALAEQPADTSLRMVAHLALGQTSLFQGALLPARAHLEHGIALYDPREHQGLSAHAGFPGDLGVFCRCFAAHTLWHLGYPDQALERIREALGLAEELAHPYSRALALAYAAMLHQFRREADHAHRTAEAAMVLCGEHGFPYYLAWATIMQGWAVAASGQGEDGVARMRDGVGALRATGAELRQPYYLTLLAEASGQTGQAQAGLTMLSEALAVARRHDERWQEAELHRLQGELLLASPMSGADSSLQPGAEAEKCFQRALAIAGHQQAKSLELRAAVSLARHWQKQGHRSDARDLLKPTYVWFTEGFDTADLHDARALLDELR